MRRFEEQYRLNEGDDVLNRENAIHQDVDLRLDAVEQLGKAFAEGNRADIEAILKSLEQTFGSLAAEMRGLLDQTVGGLSADIVVETATRYFLTDARRAAILAQALPRSGGKLTGPLEIENGDPSVELSIVGGPQDKRSWRLNNYGGDGRLYLQDRNSGSVVNNAISFGRGGDMNSIQFGDLKTYMDKGVRTDFQQTFAVPDRLKARRALRLDGSGVTYISGPTTLSEAQVGGQYLVDASGVITMPDIATVADGDGFLFVGWNGNSTVKVANGSPTVFDIFGTQPASFTLRTGQTAKVTAWSGNWLVSGYEAPWNTTLSAVEPQNFSAAQQAQLAANLGLTMPAAFQCRLSLVDQNTLKLGPVNGLNMFVNGKLRQVPQVGITEGVSASVLTPGQSYHIYTYWNGARLYLTYSQSPPVLDANGVMVCSADATITWVGHVYVLNLGQGPIFADQDQYRCVGSAYHRQWKRLYLENTTGTAGSSWTEYGSRIYWMGMGGECALFGVTGWSSTSTFDNNYSYLDVDGAQVSPAYGPPGGTNTGVPLYPMVAVPAPFGVHFGRLMARSGGSTLTVNHTKTGMVNL